MLKYRVWQPGRQGWWISNGRVSLVKYTCGHMHTDMRANQNHNWFMLRGSPYFCTIQRPCTPHPLSETEEVGGGLLFSSLPPEGHQPYSKYVRYYVIYYWVELFIIQTLSEFPATPFNIFASRVQLIFIFGDLSSISFAYSATYCRKA